MSLSIKHIFFVIMGIAALLLTWPHAFDWMRAGGNILNPIAFFGDAFTAGGTASFLSIDMAFAWVVIMVWMVFDCHRIGAGYKAGWIWVALTYIGVSFILPLYLVWRERYIDARKKQGQSTEAVTTH